MLFDFHAHLISDDPERYPVAPLSGTVRPGDLDEPMTAERLLREMDACGVERAAVVQRAHIYGFDNRYVVDSAERYPDRLEAACMIDALDAEAGAAVRHWVQERGATSIRLSEPRRGIDTSWFCGATALPVWQAASEFGVPVRIHMYRWNRLDVLADLPGMIEAFPDVTVIIDHLSNLSLESGPPDFGIDAALRGVMASGRVRLMVSTINLARLLADHLPTEAAITRIVETFGADRVLWGSDIGQTKGSYQDMVGWAIASTAGLSEQARAQLLHATAGALPTISRASSD